MPLKKIKLKLNLFTALQNTKLEELTINFTQIK